MYLLCQSDTSRGTPFFLSKRTLGNTSRPKENTSLHTVQLDMATVSMPVRAYRGVLRDFGRALKRERARMLYCSSFSPFFSFAMRMGRLRLPAATSRGDLEDGSHMSGEGSRKTEEVRGGPS